MHVHHTSDFYLDGAVVWFPPRRAQLVGQSPPREALLVGNPPRAKLPSSSGPRRRSRTRAGTTFSGIGGEKPPGASRDTETIALSRVVPRAEAEDRKSTSTMMLSLRAALRLPTTTALQKRLIVRSVYITRVYSLIAVSFFSVCEPQSTRMC